ncbi:MAG: hypothetical protein WB662_15745 [Methyloceanibacter sp.]
MSSPADKLQRDQELLHHGGFAIAAAELDQLYQSCSAFLDAACFALPDPATVSSPPWCRRLVDSFSLDAL